jgi:hypothetical protein
MARHEYREAYFEDPESITLALSDYENYLNDQVRTILQSPDVDDNTVVAISGLSSLFGLTRVSELFRVVSPHVRGRILGFFPGRYETSSYRLLDARDGWNYLAVPITATD